MLNYIVVQSKPKKIEYAHNWKEAENLAEIFVNQSTEQCQIVVAEILSIKSTGNLRSKK